MIQVFNKWDTQSIKVMDPGLERYVNLNPILVPKSGGRNTDTQFHKSKYNIIERLINKLMGAGHRSKRHKITSRHTTGKKMKTYKLVYETFSIIEKKTGKNPVEVFIRALENAAPREEINTIEYGGARYPQAVECSPQRRIDLALRLMTQGAYQKSFNSKKSAANCLADEIIAAYNLDNKSAAIAKKLELERQADASR